MNSPAEILRQCPRCGSCPRGRPRADGAPRIFTRRPVDCDADRLAQRELFAPKECPVREVLIGYEGAA